MYDYETLAKNFIETLRQGDEVRAEREATEALVAAAEGDEAVYLSMRNTLGILIGKLLEEDFRRSLETEAMLADAQESTEE